MNSKSPSELYHYCSVCGSDAVNDSSKLSCTNGDCATVIYLNPSPSVQVFLINRSNQILIVKRAKDPMKGLYDLPGGFVDGDESFESALSREVHEELGISDQLEYKYLCSAPDKYYYKGINLDVVVVTFIARVSDIVIEKIDKNEISDIKWIDIDKVEIDTLAFENSRYALTQLKK
ncbi:NUDIX domain-containing protein [Candidatus Dojkabacteria bacterium]|uniref:NUDIX domain-containing protein n=1 Tax=Candidatus Dojkabacteria bacterium TaxID=2099670 RepID=A0A955L6P4_9BACT|nr:NUDIX domain-containing protein [Candidatus Dojkabacteria bacterium]